MGFARLDAVSSPPGQSPRLRLGVAGRCREPPAQWLELGKADKGKTVRVAAGQYIRISLPGNPTTGYQWRSSEITGQSVRLLPADPKKDYVRTPVQPGIVGSGGTFFFRFQAVQPGATTIKLIYVRPWEKNVAPIDSVEIPVEVSGPETLADKEIKDEG